MSKSQKLVALFRFDTMNYYYASIEQFPLYQHNFNSKDNHLTNDLNEVRKKGKTSAEYSQREINYNRSCLQRINILKFINHLRHLLIFKSRSRLKHRLSCNCCTFESIRSIYHFYPVKEKGESHWTVNQMNRINAQHLNQEFKWTQRKRNMQLF